MPSRGVLQCSAVTYCASRRSISTLTITDTRRTETVQMRIISQLLLTSLFDYKERAGITISHWPHGITLSSHDDLAWRCGLRSLVFTGEVGCSDIFVLRWQDKVFSNHTICSQLVCWSRRLNKKRALRRVLFKHSWTVEKRQREAHNSLSCLQICEFYRWT